ncbi:MAG: glycosyltransferase family 2 protein [Candidatus Methanoperedens sp.]|nr:glycosyltransferase family 2 protein [Candidatus Methanoperedens sp.]MCE8428763.1 glycosyltransferase family 2 protein [Candidatus Methanoperedens sp.]
MFSIVIINWNGRKNLGGLLDKCLESVANTSYKNFEVLFVDNASTDGSYEYEKSRFDFKFLRNKENLGFVGGNNVGAKFCRGDVMVFLNNDTIVDAAWLNEPAKLFEKPEIGMVQSNLRMLENPAVPDSIGHIISAIVMPIENFFFTGEPIEPEPIFGGKGAALFIRRELFEKLGGFDEDYFYYFEESDLCWRARLLGYEVYFSPASRVLHKGGGTFKDGQILYHKVLHDKLLYHRQKNTISSMIKCYELKNLMKYLPLRLLFELNAILYLLFKKPSLALNNMKSLVWVLRNTEKLVKKRKQIQRTRIIRDEELFRRGFITRSMKLTFMYTKSRLGMFEAAK